MPAAVSVRLHHSLSPVVQLSALQCIISGLSGTDLHYAADLIAEDLSVPDFAGECGLLYRLDRLFLPFFRGDDDLELDLGMHEDLDFRASDYFFKASLGAETHDLGDGDTVDFYVA